MLFFFGAPSRTGPKVSQKSYFIETRKCSQSSILCAFRMKELTGNSRGVCGFFFNWRPTSSGRRFPFKLLTRLSARERAVLPQSGFLHAIAGRRDRCCLPEGRVSCPCIGSDRHPAPKFLWRRASAGASVPCCNEPKPKPSGPSPGRGLFGQRSLLLEPGDRSNLATGPAAYRRRRTCRGQWRCRFAIMQKACAGVFTSMACQFRFSTRTVALFKTSFIPSSKLRPGEKSLNKCLKRGNSSSTESIVLCFPSAITTHILKATM